MRTGREWGWHVLRCHCSECKDRGTILQSQENTFRLVHKRKSAAYLPNPREVCVVAPFDFIAYLRNKPGVTQAWNPGLGARSSSIRTICEQNKQFMELWNFTSRDATVVCMRRRSSSQIQHLAYKGSREEHCRAP